jgi:hypothetical protein
MITITDFDTAEPAYWEVVDTSGKMPTAKITYNKKDLMRYDRVNAIKQCVTFFEACGYTSQGWTPPVGKIWTLIKQD